jgi:hypothetical protein
VRPAAVSSKLGALRRGRLLLVFVTPLAAAFGAARAARAEGDPIASARLEVQALPDCTSREELMARVAARSRRIHFVDDESAGRSIRAVIGPGARPGAFVGMLVIATPDGKSATRRISAPSCAEATDALALIIALTLDPAAAVTAPAASSAAAPVSSDGAPRAGSSPDGQAARPRAAGVNPESAPGASASGDTRSVAASRRPDAAAPAETPAPSDADLTARGTAKAPPARARFSGGAAAQVVLGPAPGPLPGFTLYAMAALDRDALWSPALILAATHVWSNELVEPGGTAAFTLDALSLDACAWRLRLSVLDARLCASGLVGQLGSSGSDTYSPRSATRPFAAAGGGAFLTAALGRVLEISGRFGVDASLIRDSFEFTPEVFHRTAPLTVAASLGLGLRLP